MSRQYTGSSGKITDCQIGVFATYVSPKGHAFFESWTDAPERLASAHVPDDIRCVTKPFLATTMIRRALATEMEGSKNR